MSGKKVAIGIDLGTTKCCVGVVRDGKVKILENERSRKTTPSYVAFTETERLVGEDAKDQATLNPTNTIFGVKRIIGRGMDDSQVKKAITEMPYIIVDNAGDPCINVTYKGEEEVLLPQQVTAMILTKVKELAQHRIGCSIDEAVISVPSSFSNAQRQATKDAATIAGLKVLALINEPTAAAIAYHANRKEGAEETIAVVDFGGGKLDIAIVTVGNTHVAVKGMSGTMDLGGNNVEEILMDHVREKFKEKYAENPPNGAAVVERLRASCVKLKHSLSLLPKVQEQLDCFGDDFAVRLSINKIEYTALISDKIQSSLSMHLARALNVAGVKKESISRVVLVGGSTRIPLLFEEILNNLSSSKLDRSVNPDEAVAHGAAIYAALLSVDNTVTELRVKDILSNSFCMSLKESHELQKLTDTQMKIPGLQDITFNERDLNQTFDFFEELSGRKDPHKFIGTICLSREFARAVSLVRRVAVSIDECGISDVTVVLKGDNVFNNVLENYTGRLNEANLQEAIDREGQFRKDDQNEKERVLALTNLESLCFSIQSALPNSKGNEHFPDLVKQITSQASDAIEWLDTEKNVSKTDCIQRFKSLKTINVTLLEKLKALEKRERERVEAEQKLKTYCSSLETSLTRQDMIENHDIANELNEQLRETLEWLQSVQNPAKEECDEKNTALAKVHKAFDAKFTERQHEKERIAALSDLQEFCTTLQSTVIKDSAHEQDRDLIRQLADGIEVTIRWFDTSTEIGTKSVCEEKKAALTKLSIRIGEQQENRRAKLRENERMASIKDLHMYCTDLLKSVDVIETSNHDPNLVKLIFDEVKAARKMIGDGKTATKGECDAKKVDLESLRVKLEDSIEVFEQKRLAEREKKEENMRAELREKDRAASVAGLRAYCNNLLKSVDVIKTSNHDPNLVKLIFDEVKAVRKMIGDGKTTTKGECDANKINLEILRVKLEDSIKVLELKIESDREKLRGVALESFTSRCSAVQSVVLSDVATTHHPELVGQINKLAFDILSWLKSEKTFSQQEYASRIVPLEEAYISLLCHVEKQTKLEEATCVELTESSGSVANINNNDKDRQRLGSGGPVESNPNDRAGSKCVDNSNKRAHGSANGKPPENKNESKKMKRETRTSLKAAECANQTKNEGPAESDESDQENCVSVTNGFSQCSLS